MPKRSKGGAGGPTMRPRDPGAFRDPVVRSVFGNAARPGNWSGRVAANRLTVQLDAIERILSDADKRKGPPKGGPKR